MSEIVISATSFLKNALLVDTMKEVFRGHRIRLANPDTQLKGQELARFFQGADYAIIGKEPLDEALLTCCPRLKAVSKYGVGLDNIDQEACKRHGVKVLHTPGVNAPWVAEMAIGLALSVMRNIALTDRKLRDGTWHKNGGMGFTGKTVGVVGCGAVGSRFARLAKAFGCSLLLCDIRDVSSLSEELQGSLLSLKELLPRADVISLHVPLTPDTREFINSETLSLMKPGAVLINTSRGEVIEETGLREALKRGHLWGAGLDVWQGEPEVNPEFFQGLHLTGTPHIAANCAEAVTAMGQAAIQGLLDFCRSEGIKV